MKNDTPETDESQPSSTSSDPLTGWSAVEDYMKEHDERMIKDYADDIDTLLVFAGLFSAVLTAFVIESYHALQQDNSQTSVDLLSRISSQLESLTISGPFVNATSVSQPLVTFQASSSAIAINTLWFLSLVFSLAAALFGMFVKQWLREYMQWQSILAPPRENVLIRQMRFEAWNDWKVPTVISAIPALLEIAVLLFFSGMVVFLWTLQGVVAAIVTVSIGILFIAALLATVLPTFSLRCSYKTPTGWAFVYLVERLRRSLQSIRNRFMLGVPIYVPPDIKQWRERDLRIFDSQTIREDEKDDRLSNADVVLDISQLNILIVALAWVLSGSEEPQLIRNVSRCVQSLHATRMKIASEHEIASKLDTYFTSTTYILHHHPFKVKIDVRDRAVMEDLAMSYRKLGSPHAEIRKMGLYTFEAASHIHWDGVNTLLYWKLELQLKSAWILRRLALADLVKYANYWVTSLPQQQISGGLSDELDSFSLQQAASEREGVFTRILSLLYLLCLYAREVIRAPSNDSDSAFTEELSKALLQLYTSISTQSEAHFTGLTAMLLEALCVAGRVEYHVDGEGVNTITVIPDPSGEPLMHAILLATQLYDGGTNTETERNLFVLVSDLALRCILARRLQDYYSDPPLLVQDTQNALAGLLSRMLHMAEEALDKGYANCGCYADLPWVEHLRKILLIGQDDQAIARGVNSGTLARLLLVLQRSCHAGLLTGPTVAQDLYKLFMMAGLQKEWSVMESGDQAIDIGHFSAQAYPSEGRVLGMITPPQSPTQEHPTFQITDKGSR